jgi:uncharacterized membrane protein (UPF0127 family)
MFLTCGRPEKEKNYSSGEEKLNKIKLTVNGKTFEVEVADTPNKRIKGLMDRESLEENTGMLFVFDETRSYPFWMKDTRIPLSIAFISEEGIILEIFEMVPDNTSIVYIPRVSFRFALEMNQGWFLKNGIKIGDSVHGLSQKFK